MRRSRRGRQSGFTLVEVMVSLGVMTVASLAIFGMQQQITRANIHARQITTATQIAQNWIERLKLDAMRWTVVGDLSRTNYLRAVAAPGTRSGFIPIPLLVSTSGVDTRVMSGAFDYFGSDLNTTAGAPPNLFFCASHRLNWVFDNQRAIRADVRVWWAREGESAITTDYPLCQDDDTRLNPGPGGTNFDRYHIVYLSTVLRVGL